MAKKICIILFFTPDLASANVLPDNCADMQRILREANAIPFCQTCAPQHQQKLNEMKQAHNRCMFDISPANVTQLVGRGNEQKSAIGNQRMPFGD